MSTNIEFRAELIGNIENVYLKKKPTFTQLKEYKQLKEDFLAEKINIARYLERSDDLYSELPGPKIEIIKKPKKIIDNSKTGGNPVFI